MAPCSRCTGIILEMWPIPWMAPKFAQSWSLILYHFVDTSTLFRIFLNSVTQLPEHRGAPAMQSPSSWEHIAVHSTYLGASGNIWKHRCGCSELFSYSLITLKPFYILLIYDTKWLSADYWWWMRVVSNTESELSSLQPFTEPDNPSSWVSST